MDSIQESKLTAKDKKELPSSAYGLPKERKYPLIDKKHVIAAISYFGSCKDSKKKELARNIVKAAKKYDVHISEDSEIYKVLHESISFESLYESSIGIYLEDENDDKKEDKDNTESDDISDDDETDFGNIDDILDSDSDSDDNNDKISDSDEENSNSDTNNINSKIKSDDSESNDSDSDSSDDSNSNSDDSSGDDKDEDTSESDIDDSSSDDTDSQDIQNLQKSVFSNLTDEQIRLRTNNIKQSFIDLYNDVLDLSERLILVNKSADNIDAINYVNRSLSDLKEMLKDAVTDSFNSKSLVENQMILQRFLAVYSMLIHIIEKLPDTNDKNDDDKK